jgi:inosine-uridine nucleoside N-ribohydrolase
MGGNFLVPGNTSIGTETNFALDAMGLDYVLQHLSPNVEMVIFGLEVANEVNGDLLHFDFSSYLVPLEDHTATTSAVNGLASAKRQLSLFLQELLHHRPHCRHYDTVVSMFLLEPHRFDLQEMEVCVDNRVYSGKMLIDSQCTQCNDDDDDKCRKRKVKLAVNARL